jgi:large subunit ribosomal protein L9
MQIVLLERVEKLGQMGEIVKVRDGYARNFLLPQRKALRATEENLKYFETRRAQMEARNLEQRKDAEGVAKKLDGKSFVILRQSGETGILYGSVNSRDIANALTEGGFSTQRQQVSLTRQIKTLGMHDVRIVLHPEVSAKVKINVARSAEEAAQQEAGVNVLAGRERDEAFQLDVELDELFEDEEALRDAEEALLSDKE